MLINLLANNGYIVLNKTLMKKIGLYEAILIGELSSEQIYWEKRNELVDGFFYSTRENIEEQTMLSAYQQRLTLDNLINNNIITMKQKGMPLRTWYTINEESLFKLVSETIEKSSSQKIEHQVVKKFNNKSSNFLMPCCEEIEHHVVKNFNINNNKNNNKNNKIDRLFNYIINKEQKIPEEFSETNFDEIFGLLDYFDMLYTKDILKYSSSEENLNRIKQIVYAIATLVKENRQSTAIKITRDDIVNIYNECKIKENEYKGTENEIEDFSRYYYKSITRHYSTMEKEEIINMKDTIQSISDENCIIFLWVTFPCLIEGLQVMKEWGFKYKTCGFN